ncbi:hypothetical protein H8958_013962 [Nasalis larvatus]
MWACGDCVQSCASGLCKTGIVHGVAEPEACQRVQWAGVAGRGKYVSAVTSQANAPIRKKRAWELQNTYYRDTSPELGDPAMGFRLLCCVAFCLLGAGSVDSGVTQTPKHLITAIGQQVTLRCSPRSGDLSVYWYQQSLGQGLQFLIQYYNGKERAKGNILERFSAQQFPDLHSELNLSSLELGDSALYFCASSVAQPCVSISLLCNNIPAPLRK